MHFSLLNTCMYVKARYILLLIKTLYIYVPSSSLVPRPSHIFIATRRKGEGPGTQSHVWHVMMIDHDVA